MYERTRASGTNPKRIAGWSTLPIILCWATIAVGSEDGRAELGAPVVLKGTAGQGAGFRDEGRLTVLSSPPNSPEKWLKVLGPGAGESRLVKLESEENGLPFPAMATYELGPHLVVTAYMEKTRAGVPSWREMARSLRAKEVVYRTRWPDWAFDFRRALSPDGRLLAVTYLVTAPWKPRGLEPGDTPPPPKIRGELRVYELEGFKLKFTTPFPIDRFGEVDPFEGSERRHIPLFLGNDALAISMGREMRFFDVEQGESTSSTLSRRPMLGAIVSPDLRRIAAYDTSGETSLWNVATGVTVAELPVIEGPCGPIRPEPNGLSDGQMLRYSPSGKKLAIGVKGVIEVWDTSDPARATRLSVIRPDAKKYGDAYVDKFCRDERYLFLMSFGLLSLWDTEAPAPTAPVWTLGRLHAYGPSAPPISYFDVSPAGDRILETGENDARIYRVPEKYAGPAR